MKFEKLLKGLITLLLATGFIAFTSCSSDNDDDGNDQQQQEQAEEGTFESVTVVNINQTVVNNVTTVDNFVVEGDEVNFNLVVNNLPRSMRHRQHIHRGNRCPTLRDDTNRDGLVDEVESFSVVGDILVPLDSDIESQQSGFPNFPTSNSSGRYTYRSSGSFTRLLADLRAPDLDPNDDFGKLAPGENFNLSGHVVVFYGISASQSLPATYRSRPGHDRHEHFPVACTVLERQAGTATTTTGATTGTATTGTGTTGGGITTGGVTTGGITTGGVTTGGITTGGVTTGSVGTGAGTATGSATGTGTATGSATGTGTATGTATGTGTTGTATGTGTVGGTAGGTPGM